MKAGDELRVLADYRRVSDYRLAYRPDEPDAPVLDDPESLACAEQRVQDARRIVATLDTVFAHDNRRLRIKRHLADLQASGRL